VFYLILIETEKHMNSGGLDIRINNANAMPKASNYRSQVSSRVRFSGATPK
jgi:hypothetical protein